MRFSSTRTPFIGPVGVVADKNYTELYLFKNPHRRESLPEAIRFPGKVDVGPQNCPTDRETQVLKLIAFGYTNTEISIQLGISVKTVEAHKANGMRKMRLRSRADVVRYAVTHDWYSELSGASRTANLEQRTQQTRDLAETGFAVADQSRDTVRRQHEELAAEREEDRKKQ